MRRDSRVTKAQASALEKYFSKYEFHSGDEQLDDFSALNLEIGAGDGQCSLALALASTNKGVHRGRSLPHRPRSAVGCCS